MSNGNLQSNQGFKPSRTHLIGVGLLIALAGLGIGKACSASAEIQGQIQEGRSYLEALSHQDLSAIELAVKQSDEVYMAKMIDAKMAELQQDPKKVWELFGDAMVIGDSRAVGFNVFDCLPSNQVIAGAGYTIRNIKDAIPILEQRQPSKLFLCYGINDIGIGFWPTPDEYAQEYKEILQDLQKRLPNTRLYVNSCYPVQSRALQRGPAWAKVPQYNEAVEKMCKEIGVGYINCDKLAAENSDSYDVDGIHLRSSFYPVWGAKMIAQTISDE